MIESNRILFEDCREGTAKLPDRSIDHFYVDPPFDIGFTAVESMYNRKKKHVVKGYTEPAEPYYNFCLSWLEQCYRVLKDNGSGWICSGWSNLGDVLLAIHDAGFLVVNHVIWKYQFGVYTKHKFVTSHYHLLFVAKNHKEWYFNKEGCYADTRDNNGNSNYRDREDVWVINRPYNRGALKNANTQPLRLVEKALSYTTRKNDLVLDCFAGGGTTAVACIRLGRRYLGYEINPELKPLIDSRIAEAKNNTDAKDQNAHTI